MSDERKSRFSSLHNHTMYSLVDSINKPEELVKQAKDFGFNAIVFSEHGNMHSIIEGWKAAKTHGIKFIPGCEAYEVDDMNVENKGPRMKRYHLILLAKNNIGLKNLNKIVTISNTDGAGWKPVIDLKAIEPYAEGIICLSSCLASRLSRTLVREKCSCCPDGNHDAHYEPDWDKAIEYVNEYKRIFGDDYYIELQCHDTESQTKANQRLLKLAELTNTKYVITFDSHMLNESQQDIHRRFIKIAGDHDLSDIDTYKGCWQVDIDGIHHVMDIQIGYDAVERGIDTTDEVADKVNVEIQLHQDLMPHVDIPSEFHSEQDYLKYLINEGWKKRGFNTLPPDLKDIYKKRLHNEFEVLEYLGYCSYIIMLKNLITEFRNEEIALGYSRGSGANCLILYTIGVTEVDSIRWDLDFARFANKGRKGSPADYDIDISKAKRPRALEIAIKMFGRENIAHICTFNSLSPKVCIRDLGKVFHEEGIYDIPYNVRDSISKLIPDSADPSKKMTIEKALESSSELRHISQKYPMLFEYAKVIQNIPKSVGCHASAIAIADQPLVNLAPLMYNKDGGLMLQLEMHNAQDDLGLVKMDFLGLVTVDVIDTTLKLSGMTWNDIDLSTLDLDDQNVLENIYGKGETLGIFQMESKVVQDMFQNMIEEAKTGMKAKLSIHDVCAVAALNRPAVLDVGMDKEYIHNKHHKEDLFRNLIHPDLAAIFEPTNGIMLYQEQALKVFSLAGFAEDETDTARRAIGKKLSDVMAKLYDKFSSGLFTRKWLENQIEAIWRLIEAQAGYSFNKGHSTSYGLLSYVTAFLKYHKRIQFMTALLISEIGNYQETTKYINECHRMNIVVLPPDINKSGHGYTIVDNQILYGLEAIKGVGESAVKNILSERKNGEFTSIQDFINRCKLDTGTMTSLIKAGCFGINKNALLLEYAQSLYTFREFKPLKSLPTKAKLFEFGVINTDDQFKDKKTCLELYNNHRMREFAREQEIRLTRHVEAFTDKYMDTPDMYEFQTLNIFIVDKNPFSIIEPFIKPFDEYEDGKNAIVAGTISGIKYGKQKNGARYARIEVLTMNSGLVEGVVFSKQYSEYQKLIKKGENMVILAKKNEGQFRLDQIKTLAQWQVDNSHLLEKRVG